jgi:hypothetical protein
MTRGSGSGPLERKTRDRYQAPRGIHGGAGTGGPPRVPVTGTYEPLRLAQSSSDASARRFLCSPWRVVRSGGLVAGGRDLDVLSGGD